MSESMERAHQIQGDHHDHNDTAARWVAVLIAILTAVLAVAQMGEKSSQNAYLAHHIAVSDDWAFYQAKKLRSVLRDTEATVLESLPNADSPEVQARIKAARAYAAKAQDLTGGEGTRQLAEKARAEEHARNVAFHRYHAFELVVSALEIAIVLASVSVVTRVSAMAFGSGFIGLAAAVAALAVVMHLL